MGAEEMIEVRKDKSSKTIGIYTRVSNENIGKIKSPLDNLFGKENGGGVKGCEEEKSRR